MNKIAEFDKTERRKAGLLQLFKHVLTISGLSAGKVNPVGEKVCIMIENNYTDPDFDLMDVIRKTGYS